MACANPAPDPHAEVPFFVQVWVRQLLDPETMELLRAAGDRQIDVTLSANKAHVKRRPRIVIGGSHEVVDPADVS
jgi:hypothetical protein